MGRNDTISNGNNESIKRSKSERILRSLDYNSSDNIGVLSRAPLLSDSQINSKIIGQNDSKSYLNVKRIAYTLPQFNEQFEVIKDSRKSTMAKKVIDFIRPRFSITSINHKIKSIFPILDWLRNYDIKQNLLVDIIAGFTILVFQVPQSMGYSLIAKVDAVYGLYSSFFPALVYAFMGTSRHCAIGTFAVVSLMTGSLIRQVLTTKELESTPKIEIAMVIAFLIGVYQLIFGILRLGFVSVYMSDQLTSGFTTACSVYVFTSQLPYLCGYEIDHPSGPFGLVHTFKQLIDSIDKINIPTITISFISCGLMLLFKLLINPLIGKKYSINIPFPIELILVIGGIVASHLLDMESRWNVKIVGNIPTGLPMPRVPRLDLIRELAVSSIPVAIVAYTLTISVGKILATRHKYKVDPNQELVALGATNLFSSFFSCIPSAASLSRSAVQESSGGRTQMVSIVNCIGLLFVLFSAGPVLEKLPNCILASIIVVSLKSLMLQVIDFTRYWRLSRLDGSIWLMTFFSVLILDVDIGLYLGLTYSLLTLIYKFQRPKTYLLGSVNYSDVYVPINKYASAIEISGIKIYQFCGPLHFANVEYFKRGLLKKTGVKTKNNFSEKVQVYKSHEKNENNQNNMAEEDIDHNCNNDSKKCATITPSLDEITFGSSQPTHIIIDCSMFSYIDTAGVKQLKETILEYSNIGVKIFLACVATHVHKMLEKDDFFVVIPNYHVYITIHDAVHHALDDQKVTRRYDNDNSERKTTKN